jgi:hypothetical protein
MMSNTPSWQPAFVLPNLLSEEPLTLGLEGIAIVPDSDERVEEIKRWSPEGKRFLECFHDGYGKSVAPSVLIVRTDWDADMNRTAEPLIAFRNSVALVSILRARSWWSPNGGGWLGASWADSFDYHPATLRPDGSSWDVDTPALRSIGFRTKELRLTPSIGLTRNSLATKYIDTHLAERLGRVWHLRYRQGNNSSETRRVFRSAESAYEALAMSSRHYGSLDEIGLGAVPWATAIEILAAPGKGYVEKDHCLELIGRVPCRDQVLRDYQWTRPGKREGCLNLPQRIFWYIYGARSTFVHGKEASRKLLLPFGDKAPPLLSLASTVYRIALVRYLEEKWPWRKSPGDLDFWDLVGTMEYEGHLMKAIQDQ